MKSYSIIFNCDNNYAKYTYIAMYTIMSLLSEKTNIVFYVFSDLTFDEENELLIKSIEKSFQNAKANFVRISLEEDYSLSGHRLTKACLYRLLAPLYVKEDKCLYLDQDILVRRSIEPILEYDLGRNLIAGVEDPGASQIKERLRQDGFYLKEEEEQDIYVNAGVLLMNLKEMRALSWKQIILDLLKYQFDLMDQDIINVACRGKIASMPKEYNYLALNGVPEMEPTIVHYTGSQKPWSCPYMIMADEWWRLCSETKVFREVVREEAESLFLYMIYSSGRVSSKKELYDFCNNHSVILYGAGKVARRVIKDLKQNNIEIQGIAVTESNNEMSQIEGIPIKPISEYYADAKKTSVLIATIKDNDKISLELYKKEFENIFPISFLYKGV